MAIDALFLNESDKNREIYQLFEIIDWMAISLTSLPVQIILMSLISAF